MGAEDFIKVFVKTLDNTKPMKSDDRKKLMSMLNDLRLAMIMHYQQEIKRENETRVN